MFVCVFVLKELDRAQARVALLEKDLALEVHRREQVKGGNYLLVVENRHVVSPQYPSLVWLTISPLSCANYDLL